MEIKELLKIPKIREYLNNNKFEKIYQGFRDGTFSLDGESLAVSIEGEFTELLYKAGIDPLNYMKEIPEFFGYETNFKSFSIPNNIKSIGRMAFAECKSLIKVDFSKNLEYINDRAFLNCEALTEIILPDSILYIGESAFNGCENLTKLVLGSKLSEFSPDIIERTNLKEIFYNNTYYKWLDLANTAFAYTLPNYINQMRKCKIICSDGYVLTWDKEYKSWR